MAQRSPWCEDGVHEECPHEHGSGVRLWGRGPRSFLGLCGCHCHAGCPLAGRTEPSEDEWLDRCTCPGSAEWKVRRVEGSAEREAQRALRREATIAADQRAATGEPFELALTEELEARGLPANPDVVRFSGGLRAARDSPRVLRSLRVAGALARGARDAVRSFRSRPREDDD